MDFFKACRSNVLLMEGISHTKFRVFNAKSSEQAKSGTIRQLREAGVLCTVAGSQLWVFSAPDEHEDAATKLDAVLAKDRELTEDINGTLETDVSEAKNDKETARRVLLHAIEGSISYRLARESGAMHIGPCIWLLNGGPDDTGILLRLKLEYVIPNALYATTLTEVGGIVALDLADISSDDDLILAPIGRKARLTRDEKSAHDTVKSIDMIQSTSAGTGSSWKASVADLLLSEGIEIRDNERWALVKLDGEFEDDVVMWPERCVFRIKDRGYTLGGTRLSNVDWRYWFTIPGEDSRFNNPLTTAEEWFTGAADRARNAAEAAKAQEHRTVNSTDSALPFTGGEADNITSTSPSFAQRNDQQVAVGGIYPTPPDGLVPGFQPQNIEAVLASAQPEQNGMSTDPVAVDDETQSRDQNMESPNDAQAFPTNDDDLFGDMDEMDFGGDEVGDADFSFFDEPDDEPASRGAENSEMMEITYSNTEAPTNEQEPAAGDPKASGGQELQTTGDSQADDLNPAVEEAQSSNIDHSSSPQDVLEAPESEMSLLKTEENSEAVEPEKPLSPFGVKERLLPPPIPASAKQREASLSHTRRSSTFDPVVFRESVDLSQKYAGNLNLDQRALQDAGTHEKFNISLPTKRKKPIIKRPSETDSDRSDRGDESEDDSYESASSLSDDNLPPKLPWDTRKRKRSDDHDRATNDHAWPDQSVTTGAETSFDIDELSGWLRRMTSSPSRALFTNELDALATRKIRVHPTNTLPPIETLLQIAKLDLVYTAQLAAEQSVSCTTLILEELALNTTNPSNDLTVTSLACQTLIEKILQHIMPSCTTCSISDLALTREASRQVTAPGRPGQPRPPVRMDTMSLGPDFHLIPPPYVRVQRGPDVFEMLPPALDFWETLSLGPSNVAKDVRAFCVYPSNDELRSTVDIFLSELSAAYESCKLGSHVHVRNMSEEYPLDDYEDGLVPVDLAEDDNLETTLRAYSSICADLGALLSMIAHLESERTFVIYMINPFAHVNSAHHLCAAFWSLYNVYRGHLSKIKDGKPRSDIVLQLLPIELLAAYEAPVVLDTRQMNMIAKETYDRCPPSALDVLNAKITLPGFTAPFVELATIPPRRINFQLTADPPADLMHEPSVLHLAYALSKDGEWLTASWVDNIGRNQSSLSFCLRGKCFADVAEDVWTRTREIMSARDVTWRLFILAADAPESSIQQCWRKLVTQPRKHMFHATFLYADSDPNLRLIPPQPMIDSPVVGGPLNANVLTPASTPQGTTPFTFSPDASSHTAPPTPAPTDTSAAITENDPDAHLIDLADESWAVIFSPTFARTNSISPGSDSGSSPPKQPMTASSLVTGALFKRGDPSIDHYSPVSPSSAKPLPSICVSLHWTIQVRPNSNIDEGNVRQAEATLREVLRTYRNLSVLTRARGLACNGDERSRNWAVMPVHLVMALRGAEGIDGMLK